MYKFHNDEVDDQLLDLVLLLSYIKATTSDSQVKIDSDCHKKDRVDRHIPCLKFSPLHAGTDCGNPKREVPVGDGTQVNRFVKFVIPL